MNWFRGKPKYAYSSMMTADGAQDAQAMTKECQPVTVFVLVRKEAIACVVVDDACGLQKCIDDGGADEVEPAFFQVF